VTDDPLEPDSYYGMCSCGWVGPLHKAPEDARHDLGEHYRKTGHRDAPSPHEEPDDLMPHERNRTP